MSLNKELTRQREAAEFDKLRLRAETDRQQREEAEKRRRQEEEQQRRREDEQYRDSAEESGHGIFMKQR